MIKQRILVITALLLGALPVFAGEPPALTQHCVACHGVAGVSNNPQWPNLAGQNADYMTVQLIAFRDGVRSNPMMDAVVADLSDEDARVLSQWYASLDRATSGSGDAKLLAVGEHLSAYCKACHGMTGEPVATEWPVLAGQQGPYLQRQLQAFKNGSRISPFMQAALSQLSEHEFAALAAYYSQFSSE
ncbi:MAG: cytochrome c [Proteobacteria bacterium]|nr:cytochrome c [Pseudomonadota bacterium]